VQRDAQGRGPAYQVVFATPYGVFPRVSGFFGRNLTLWGQNLRFLRLFWCKFECFTVVLVFLGLF
jgi:hypothetical protein